MQESRSYPLAVQHDTWLPVAYPSAWCPCLYFRTPRRRLVRESRSHPLAVQPVSRFSSQWLILLSDVLVYISGATQILYNLDTVWVETVPDNDAVQVGITIFVSLYILLSFAYGYMWNIGWIQSTFNQYYKKQQSVFPLYFCYTLRYFKNVWSNILSKNWTVPWRLGWI